MVISVPLGSGWPNSYRGKPDLGIAGPTPIEVKPTLASWVNSYRGITDLGILGQLPDDGEGEPFLTASERAEIAGEQVWHHVDPLVHQINRRSPGSCFQVDRRSYVAEEEGEEQEGEEEEEKED